MNILNIRFITTSEPKAGGGKGKWQGEKFKKMIGNDYCTSRALYSSKNVSRKLMGTIWFSCNNIPEFDGDDGGMQRRIKRIVFPHYFKDDGKHLPTYKEGINDLAAKLESDKWRDAAILIMLEYYRDYIMGCEMGSKKYNEPKSVRTDTEQMVADNSSFKDLCKDTITTSTDNKSNYS